MFYRLFVKAVPPSFGGSSLVFPSCCRDLLDFWGCVGVVFRLLHPGPTCDSQKQCNQKEEYCSDFKQPSAWYPRALVSCRSRPNQKFDEFHILILVGSRPPLNPFIVIFLCQSAYPIFAEFQPWKRHMPQVREEIYFCFLVFESFGVFPTPFNLSFSRAFLYKAFCVWETAS